MNCKIDNNGEKMIILSAKIAARKKGAAKW